MTIPTPDEICERLRNGGHCREAADLIQQQQATIERLSAALEKYEALISAESIEAMAKDIACAVTDPRFVTETRHNAMVRLGRRLRDPLEIDLNRARAALGKDAK